MRPGGFVIREACGPGARHPAGMRPGLATAQACGLRARHRAGVWPAGSPPGRRVTCELAAPQPCDRPAAASVGCGRPWASRWQPR